MPGPGDTTRGGPGDLGGQFIGGSASWTRWWAFNREPFLAELRMSGSGRAMAMPLQGERPTTSIPGLSQRKVFEEVVPMLQGHLEDTRDNDLAVGCLLALGKIGEAPHGLAKELELTSVESSILPRLKDSNERVRDAAVISLGLVGGPKAAALLASIVQGLDEGKKAVGGRRVDERTQAFATYALGLVAHHTRRPSERTFIVSHLLKIAEEHYKHTELAAAAVISLGWAPLPLAPKPAGQKGAASGQELTIRRLYALYVEDGTDLRARAHIPVAIARLIQAEAGTPDPQAALAIAARREQLRLEFVGRFAAGLAARGGDKVVSAREGLALALGLLTEPRPDGPDREAMDRLLDLTKKGQDREGGLASIALARIAARAGADRESARAEMARGITGALAELAVNGNGSQRPWATLSLGLYERAVIAAGAPPSLKHRALLRDRLEDAASPEAASAAGMALGLASDEEAIPEVTRGLSGGDYTVRGLYATALALLEATTSIQTLRDIAADDLVAPVVLREVSITLALLRDDFLVELLVGKLARARFMPERIAALQGLAWCNDPGAVPALLYVMREKRIGRRKIDDTSRAFAAAALGAVCSRRSLPWNAHLALDVNWNAAPPSLTHARNGGGVLDLF